MRVEDDAGSEVYYILTDHLGSTSLTYRASGGVTTTQRYKPLRPTQGRLRVEVRL